MLSLQTLLQSTTENVFYLVDNNVEYPTPTMILQDKISPIHTDPTSNQEHSGEPTDTFRIGKENPKVI